MKKIRIDGFEYTERCEIIDGVESCYLYIVIDGVEYTKVFIDFTRYLDPYDCYVYDMSEDENGEDEFDRMLNDL